MKKSHIIFLISFALVTVFSACQKTFDYDPADIPNDFTPLPAPALGSGYQLHVAPFPVPANFEREWFMRLPVGNTEDIYVTKFQSKCRPGTHHLVAYGYENENAPWQPQIGVMRDQNRPDGRGNFRGGMFGTLNYYTAQSEEFELQLPAGLAVKIPGGATVDLNSHYYNKTKDTRFGEVYLNFNTIDSSLVTTVLSTELVNNQDILFLPAHQVTTINYTQLMPSKRTVYAITSHMHRHGKLFRAYVVGGSRDGELLLEATDYKHPPQIFLTQPLVLLEGQGIRTEITYDNDGSRELEFGVTSEDEMGIAFYLYEQN